MMSVQSKDQMGIKRIFEGHQRMPKMARFLMRWSMQHLSDRALYEERMTFNMSETNDVDKGEK